MPVGTYGTVKAMAPEELQAMGVEIVLGNTFHLWLRPGTEIIAAHGDLHDFMHWEGPILTDSGGYQVFSLRSLMRIDDEGVTLRSHVDGSLHTLTPRRVMAVQAALGSDIAMAFDECLPAKADRARVTPSVDRTARWAERSKQAHEGNPAALFGIVQGGMYEGLRDQSLKGLTDIGFFDVDSLGNIIIANHKSKEHYIFLLQNEVR